MTTTMGETYLEDEEKAYRGMYAGRMARVIISRNEYSPSLDLPYGSLRTVHVGLPDTYFTIPAVLRYRGRRVKGFVSVDTDAEIFTFTPNPTKEA